MLPLLAYVIDNDIGQLLNLEPTVFRLLSTMGYQCTVKALYIESPNDEREKAKLQEALAARPDVMFFDNHFGEAPGLASFGFQFISSVKRHFPDTVFVLMTRESLNNNEFGKATPHPDIIVSKLRLIANERRGPGDNKETYQEFFQGEFRRVFRRAKVEQIIIPPALQQAFDGMRSTGRRKTPLSSLELRSIVEQICFMGRDPTDKEITTVELEKLEGGLSGSVVCTIRLSEDKTPYRVPGVIKFSTRDNAKREIQNHSRYVKWVLPYNWRVDIIGTGEAEKFGAVCYSFAQGGSEKPISLETSIKRACGNQVAAVISAVFDPRSQTWYEQRKSVEMDIGAYFSGVRPYFINPDDRAQKADRLRSIITSVCEKNNIRVILNKGTHIIEFGGKLIDLKNFEEKLFSEHWGVSVIECISHGDLNAGNIMVRSDTAAFSFIDFRHTGWHHRARDFCSIEGSLRTLYPRTKAVKDFSGYLRREIAAIQHEEIQLRSIEDAKSATEAYDEYEKRRRQLDFTKANENSDRDVIGLIRAAYLGNFVGASYKEYCLAQLLHAWWLICFEDTWVESQIEILAAEILALLFFLWDREGLH